MKGKPLVYENGKCKFFENPMWWENSEIFNFASKKNIRKYKIMKKFFNSVIIEFHLISNIILQLCMGSAYFCVWHLVYNKLSIFTPRYFALWTLLSLNSYVYEFVSQSS